MNQLRPITRELPLKTLHTTTCLEVRILHPGSHYALIAQILKLFEQEQADHQPDWLGPACRNWHTTVQTPSRASPWGFSSPTAATEPAGSAAQADPHTKLPCFWREGVFGFIEIPFHFNHVLCHVLHTLLKTDTVFLLNFQCIS